MSNPEFSPDVPNNEEVETEPKPTVEELIASAEETLAGEDEGDVEKIPSVGVGEVVPGGFELGDGPILDYQDERYNDEERGRLREYLEGKLGDTLENAPASTVLEFIDGSMRMSVYNSRFGTEENVWRITKWENVDEEGILQPPAYVLRSQSMIDADQEEGLYISVEEDEEIS